MVPMVNLCAITRMDRTIASAKMDSKRTAQSVKVQYNLAFKMSIRYELLIRFIPFCVQYFAMLVGAFF